jgi:hypothetical protein
VPPLVGAPGIYQVGLATVVSTLAFAPFAGAWSAVQLTRILRTSKRDGINFPVGVLLLSALLWADPLGAVSWFLD